MNLKAGDNTGCHFKHQRVDHKGKKPQGQNVDWKGNKKCDGSKKGVKDTQHGGSEKRRKKPVYVDAAKQIGCKNDGPGRGQPPDKYPTHRFEITGR